MIINKIRCHCGQGTKQQQVSSAEYTLKQQQLSSATQILWFPCRHSTELECRLPTYPKEGKQSKTLVLFIKETYVRYLT